MCEVCLGWQLTVYSFVPNLTNLFGKWKMGGGSNIVRRVRHKKTKSLLWRECKSIEKKKAEKEDFKRQRKLQSSKQYYDTMLLWPTPEFCQALTSIFLIENLTQFPHLRLLNHCCCFTCLQIVIICNSSIPPLCAPFSHPQIIPASICPSEPHSLCASLLHSILNNTIHLFLNQD